MAPLAAILVSGGFFGVAFHQAFGVVLWLGAACLVVSVVVTGVGLMRAPVRIESGDGDAS
jgi:hypothetical protein